MQPGASISSWVWCLNVCLSELYPLLSKLLAPSRVLIGGSHQQGEVTTHGYGSKLNHRPQIFVIFMYQGNPFGGYPIFDRQPYLRHGQRTRVGKEFESPQNKNPEHWQFRLPSRRASGGLVQYNRLNLSAPHAEPLGFSGSGRLGGFRWLEVGFFPPPPFWRPCLTNHN